MSLRYLSFETARIEPQEGVIRGVSLISEGPAIGHGLMIDGKTLDQVLLCCQQAGTIKVKADHGSGVLATIGYLDNFSKGGGKVLGDFYLYDAEPEKPRLLEIAAKNPGHLGISLEFMGKDEVVNGLKMARCNSVSAAALVSDPAANKSLFEKKSDATEKSIAQISESEYKYLGMYKTPKKLGEKDESEKDGKVTEQDMDKTPGTSPDAAPSSMGDIAASIKAIHDKLSEHGAKLDAVHQHCMDYGMDMEKVPDLTSDDDSTKAKPPAIDPNTQPETQNIDTSRIDGQGSAKDSEPGRPQTKDNVWEQEEKGNGMKAKIKPVIKNDLSAMQAEMKKMAAKLGLRVLPVGTSGDRVNQDTKTFDQLVEEKARELNGDKAKAILFCIKNHKQEYALSRPVGPRTLEA